MVEHVTGGDHADFSELEFLLHGFLLITQSVLGTRVELLIEKSVDLRVSLGSFWCREVIELEVVAVGTGVIK